MHLCLKELGVSVCVVQHRLISQCAVQPGLGKVYSQILLQTHTSAEFYLKVRALCKLHSHDTELMLVQLAVWLGLLICLHEATCCCGW